MKRVWPFIRTNLNTLHSRKLFEPSLVETGLVVLGNEMKMRKALKQMDRQTNGKTVRKQAMKKAPLRFLL